MEQQKPTGKPENEIIEIYHAPRPGCDFTVLKEDEQGNIIYLQTPEGTKRRDPVTGDPMPVCLNKCFLPVNVSGKRSGESIFILTKADSDFSATQKALEKLRKDRFLGVRGEEDYQRDKNPAAYEARKEVARLKDENANFKKAKENDQGIIAKLQADLARLTSGSGGRR